MKVVLLTMDEPMYMPRYLEPLFREQRDRITKVVLAPHPNEDLATTIRQRYRMFGPKDFLKFGLRFARGRLLSFLPPRRQLELTDRYHSVRSLASEFEIPIETEENINREEFVSELREIEPDLILSISCQQLLGDELLKIPKRGAINIHGSLLPKYQGRATAFWVLYEGEKESGVTAHYMTSEYDAGEILLQHRFDIASDDTMDDVYNKVVETGSRLAIDLIDRVADGEIESKPNRTDEGEYRSLPGPDARQEFKRRGNEFL